MKSKFYLFVIIAPLFSIFLSFVLAAYFYFRPYSGPDTEFTIHKGEGFASINYRLKKEDIISNLRIFYYLTRSKGLMNSFKMGTFSIKAGDTMSTVLHTLVFGGPKQTQVTIPEGKNMYEVASILEDLKICSRQEFLSLAQNNILMHSLNIPADTVEGYLYPETYHFIKDSDARQILISMVRLHREKTKDLSFEHTSLTPHQVIILASIVEKETGAKIERPLISGVFLNRLKKRMRLQSDPTTIYGIWNRYDGNLRKQDLLEKTPYNTYKISGLPKGPIANPGRESIEAVLFPTKHKYLYFVSKNDGTHVFSADYSQHSKAVDYFQKIPANRQGKSWRDLKQ